MNTKLWFEELPGEILHRIVHYVVPEDLELRHIERLLLRIRAMLPLLKERHALLRVTEAAVTLMLKNTRNLYLSNNNLWLNFHPTTRRVCALLAGRASDGVCILSMSVKIERPDLIPEIVKVFNKLDAKKEYMLIEPCYKRMVYQSLKDTPKENCGEFTFVSLPQQYDKGIRGFYQPRDFKNKWIRASTWARRYGKAKRLGYSRGGEWHTHVPSFALKALLTHPSKHDEEDKRVDLDFFDPEVNATSEYSNYGETHRSVSMGGVNLVFS